MKALTVRSGKGDKDRITTFPEMLVQPLKEQLLTLNRHLAVSHRDGHGPPCNERPGACQGSARFTRPTRGFRPT